MPRQLSFDLPAKPALGREDFFISPANALAVALLDQPDTWTSGKLVLSGPQGAGKSHLVQVWAETSGARVVTARDLPGADIEALADGPVAVEDVPDIAGDAAAQDALFHLHNLTLANGHHLMMTGRGAPNLWGMSLPDLQSRIDAALVAELRAPDDALLAAVMAKLFTDRQIAPKPDVIPYLVSRIDRSFAAAAASVDRLDQLAMREKRNLTRRLAERVLGDDARDA